MMEEPTGWIEKHQDWKWWKDEAYKAMARAEAAEKALREIATECSTFPIKNGLAFRCESIARAALEAKP